MLDQAGMTNTLTFSSTLVNPVMAFVSIGAPTIALQYDFNSPFTLLSEGLGKFGDGTWQQLSGDILEGKEAHGVIQFNGTFSSISWTNDVAEGWHGFTIGSTGGAQPVPEPSTVLLLGIGLVGLAGAAVRRRRKRVK